MKRDEKTTVSLPQQPHVDPGRAAVAARSPAAAAYQASLLARRTTEARGGGAAPPIPPLNAPHNEGMTMADQAAAMRQPPPQAAQGAHGTIFTPETAAQASTALNKGILMSDLLPETARRDPTWQEGHGSAYAINQQHLARKYGVLRSGKHVPPQELMTGAPGLRPQTVKGLEDLKKFQEQRQSSESGNTAAERASENSPAGEAAKLAGGDAKPVTTEQRAEAEKALANMDEFDFNAFREIMMKDLINNEDQKKIVEARIEPLELSELIMNGRIKQHIPIIPGKYEPTFQSLTGEDELALRRLVMQDKQGLEAADRYLLDKFQMMTIAAGVTKINTTVIPDHTKDGNFDDDLFWKKFNRVLKFPLHMLASLGVHYFWFDTRVRKLFVAEKLGNG